MLRHVRRLPPLLRALWLLALLLLLLLVATLGAYTWAGALLRDHEDVSARRAQALVPAFALLALACNWPVVAYNTRFLRPGRVLPWLDTWRGQLAAVLGLAALPLGVVAVVLFIPPRSPLSVLQVLLFPLAALVLGAAYVWLGT